MAIELPKIKLTSEEIKLIISALEQIASFLISKTDLTEEDKQRLIAVQDRLQQLKSKEQQIADGK